MWNTFSFIWAAIDLFAIWLFENVLRHFPKVNTEQICWFEGSDKKNNSKFTYQLSWRMENS